MARGKQLKVPKMSRLEARAWDIMAERNLQGRPCEFKVAYAAAVAELAKRRKLRQERSRK